MAQELGAEELLGPGSEIVAVVNGQELTRQELADLLIESFGEQGLNVLIRRTVIYQQADKLGITINPEEVNQRLENLLNREINALLQARGLADEEQLRDELSKMGMNLDDLKEKMSARLRKGMEVELLAEKIVGTTVTITEEDLKKAYDREYGEKIEASQIMVSTRKEADEILEKVQSGADFETLARNESIDRLSAAAGGRIDPFSPNEGVFGPKVAYLEVGQVSDIIKTENGYHILKILNKIEKSEKDLDEVVPELENIVKRQKVKKRLAPWLASVLERAEITKYLVTY
ncbi:MAG: peptidylprolyl isomerase [Candidatus Brocadiales bacterium]